MALSFDPTKKIKKITSESKIFEEPLSQKSNLRTMDGKPTEINKIDYTENLRTMDGSSVSKKIKPTDTPTDNGRKILRTMDGKPTEIKLLVGQQRKVFYYIAEKSQKLGFNDHEGNRISSEINGNNLAKELGIQSYKAVKDLIYELKVKNYLSVYFAKNGKGGFVQFLIKKELFQQYLLNQSMDVSTDNGRIMDGKPTGIPTDIPTEEIYSKKEREDLNLKYKSFFLEQFPNVQKSGLRLEHLEKTERSAEQVEELLSHFEHSLINNEIKASFKLPVILSVLNEKTKTWISESYLKQIHTEVEQNNLRQQELINLKKQKREQLQRDMFEDFKLNNQAEYEKMKSEQNTAGLKINEDVLDKIVFQKFIEEKCV